MPKVSVIVPNYNHARFLEQRIQSILNQTYQDFELIYLDDASTDNSNEVFAPFADSPRVRTILNTTNSGSPFKQWNKGIQHANGEYIWIAESDDYADPTLLEKLVEILEQHPSVGLAYCQSILTTREGKNKSTLCFHTDSLDPQRWKSNFINNGKDECRNYLICKNTIPNASAVVFRRSMYEQIGGADESKILCGDWLTWVKILMCSDVAFISEPLNYFREHINTSRSRLTKLGYELTECFDIVEEITQNSEVSSDSLHRATEQLFQRWIQCLYSESSTVKSNFIHYKRIINISNDITFKVYVYQRLIRIVLPFIRFKLGLGAKLKRRFFWV